MRENKTSRRVRCVYWQRPSPSWGQYESHHWFYFFFSDFSLFLAKLQFHGEVKKLLRMRFTRKSKSDLHFNKTQQISRLLKTKWSSSSLQWDTEEIYYDSSEVLCLLISDCWKFPLICYLGPQYWFLRLIYSHSINC